MFWITVLCFSAIFAGIQSLQGGTIVNYNTAPFHLNLRLNTTHICGATLITDVWLLTAAQCLRSSDLTEWLTVTSIDPDVANRNVEQVIKHPNFDLYSLDNDIAVLRVATAYNFTAEAVRVLPLVPENYDFAPGTLANITGYGTASLWPVLHAANATLITFDECEMEYYRTGLPESAICARATAVLSAGDAGAPLVVQGRGVAMASKQLTRAASVFTSLALPRVRGFIQQHAGV